jgi:hypothetical protein
MIIPNFTTAANVKVQMYLPTLVTNPFLVGISYLGGDDVLDGDMNPNVNWSWKDVQADTVKVAYTIGGDIANGLLFKPAPATATITLQSLTYDPSANKAVRAGTKIRVVLSNSTQEIKFNGFIDTIGVSYNTNGLNVINIRAFDAYKRLANSRYNYDTTALSPALAGNTLNSILTGIGYTLSSSSDAGVIQLPSESRTGDNAVGTIIQEVLDASLGILWVDPATGQIVYKDRPAPTTGTPSGIYTVGTNHPVYPATDDYHLCMTGLDIQADSSEVINSLKVILATNTATSVLRTDADAIELYGALAQDVTVRVKDSTQLDLWADKAFQQSPTKNVENVTALTIDRAGTLTHAVDFQPGDTVRVYYSKRGLVINDYYQIIQVTQNLDVNNWFTNLKLWRAY